MNYCNLHVPLKWLGFYSILFHDILEPLHLSINAFFDSLIYIWSKTINNSSITIPKEFSMNDDD